MENSKQTAIAIAVSRYRNKHQQMLADLQRRAELSMELHRSPEEICEHLQDVLAHAPTQSEPALFAHQHLAELFLHQEQPWQAALHLRTALTHHPQQHRLWAWMGLCQAMLHHFQYAVSCYQRAVRQAPDIAWYQHNLGHLWDTVLHDPTSAESHLRAASALAPGDDEMLASLAQCIAQLGQTNEARMLAKKAMTYAPENPSHQALYDWICEDTQQASP